jgi:hypothetical protein
MYAEIRAHGVRPHVTTHISAHLHLQPSLCVAKSYAYTHFYVRICSRTPVYIHTRVYAYVYICMHMYSLVSISSLRPRSLRAHGRCLAGEKVLHVQLLSH